MAVSRREVKFKLKLIRMKNDIDCEMFSLNQAFENQENLKPGWHKNALKQCIKNRKKLVDFAVDFIVLGIIEMELYNRKIDKFDDIKDRLENMSRTNHCNRK